MANGAHSELPLKIQGGKGYSTVYIKPDHASVRRVVMKGDNEFGGVVFYDKENKKVIEAGHCSTLYSREFSLKENERLVGIKSHLIGKLGSSISPRQEDLVFIIGWLEWLIIYLTFSLIGLKTSLTEISLTSSPAALLAEVDIFKAGSLGLPASSAGYLRLNVDQAFVAEWLGSEARIKQGPAAFMATTVV